MEPGSNESPMSSKQMPWGSQPYFRSVRSNVSEIGIRDQNLQRNILSIRQKLLNQLDDEPTRQTTFVLNPGKSRPSLKEHALPRVQSGANFAGPVASASNKNMLSKHLAQTLTSAHSHSNRLPNSTGNHHLIASGEKRINVSSSRSHELEQMVNSQRVQIQQLRMEISRLTQGMRKTENFLKGNTSPSQCVECQRLRFLLQKLQNDYNLIKRSSFERTSQLEAELRSTLLEREEWKKRFSLLTRESQDVSQTLKQLRADFSSPADRKGPNLTEIEALRQQVSELTLENRRKEEEVYGFIIKQQQFEFESQKYRQEKSLHISGLQNQIHMLEGRLNEVMSQPGRNEKVLEDRNMLTRSLEQLKMENRSLKISNSSLKKQLEKLTLTDGLAPVPHALQSPVDLMQSQGSRQTISEVQKHDYEYMSTSLEKCKERIQHLTRSNQDQMQAIAEHTQTIMMKDQVIAQLKAQLQQDLSGGAVYQQNAVNWQAQYNQNIASSGGESVANTGPQNVNEIGKQGIGRSTHVLSQNMVNELHEAKIYIERLTYERETLSISLKKAQTLKKQLLMELDKKNSELNDASDLSKAHKKQIKQLTKTIAELMKKIQELHQAIMNKNMEIVTFEDVMVGQLNLNIAKITKENEQLRSKIAFSTEQLYTYQTNAEQMRVENDRMREQIKGLVAGNAQANILEQKYANMQSELSALKYQHSQQNDEDTEKTKKYMRDNQRLRKQVLSLQQELQQSLIRNQQLNMTRQKLTALKDDNEQIQIETSQKNVQLQTRVSLLERQLKDLQEQSNKQMNEIAILNASLQKQVEKQREQETDKELMIQIDSQAKLKIQALQGQLQSQCNEITEKDHQINSLTFEVNQLRQLLVEEKSLRNVSQVQDLRKNIHELSEIITALRQDNQKMLSERDEAVRQGQILSSQNKSLQIDQNILVHQRSDNEQLRETISKLEQDLHFRQQQGDDQGVRKLAEMEQRLRDMETRLVQSCHENQLLKSSVESVIKQKTQTEEQLHNLLPRIQDNASLRKDNQLMLNDINRLQAQVQRLSKQLQAMSTSSQDKQIQQMVLQRHNAEDTIQKLKAEIINLDQRTSQEKAQLSHQLQKTMTDSISLKKQNEQVHKLRQENQMLAYQLEKQQNTHQTQEMLESQAQRLSQQLSIKSMEIMNMKKQAQESQDKEKQIHQQLRFELSRAEQQIKNLQQAMNNPQQVNTERITLLEQEVKTLKNQLSETQANLRKVYLQVQETVHHNQELRDQNQRLRKDVAAMQVDMKELNGMRSDNIAMLNDINAMQADIKRHIEQNQELRDANRKQALQFQHEKQKLVSQVNDLSVHNENLRLDHERKRNDYSQQQQQSQISSLRAERDNLLNEATSQKLQSNRSVEQIQELKKLLNQSKSVNQQYQGQIAKLQQICSSQKTNLIEYNNELQLLRKQIKTVTSDVLPTLQQTIQNPNQDNIQLKRCNEQMHQDLVRMQSEINVLVDENRRLAEKEQQTALLQKDNEQMHQDLVRMQSEINVLVDENRRLAEKEQEIAELITDNEKMYNNLVRIQQQLDIARLEKANSSSIVEEHRSLSSDYEALKSQNLQLKTQLQERSSGMPQAQIQNLLRDNQQMYADLVKMSSDLRNLSLENEKLRDCVQQRELQHQQSLQQKQNQLQQQQINHDQKWNNQLAELKKLEISINKLSSENQLLRQQVVQETRKNLKLKESAAKQQSSPSQIELEQASRTAKEAQQKLILFEEQKARMIIHNSEMKQTLERIRKDMEKNLQVFNRTQDELSSQRQRNECLRKNIQTKLLESEISFEKIMKRIENIENGLKSINIPEIFAMLGQIQSELAQTPQNLTKTIQEQKKRIVEAAGEHVGMSNRLETRGLGSSRDHDLLSELNEKLLEIEKCKRTQYLQIQKLEHLRDSEAKLSSAYHKIEELQRRLELFEEFSPKNIVDGSLGREGSPIANIEDFQQIEAQESPEIIKQLKRENENLKQQCQMTSQDRDECIQNIEALEESLSGMRNQLAKYEQQCKQKLLQSEQALRAQFQDQILNEKMKNENACAERDSLSKRIAELEKQHFQLSKLIYDRQKGTKGQGSGSQGNTHSSVPQQQIRNTQNADQSLDPNSLAQTKDIQGNSQNSDHQESQVSEPIHLLKQKLKQTENRVDTVSNELRNSRQSNQEMDQQLQSINQFFNQITSKDSKQAGKPLMQIIPTVFNRLDDRVRELNRRIEELQLQLEHNTQAIGRIYEEYQSLGTGEYRQISTHADSNQGYGQVPHTNLNMVQKLERESALLAQENEGLKSSLEFLKNERESILRDHGMIVEDFKGVEEQVKQKATIIDQLESMIKRYEEERRRARNPHGLEQSQQIDLQSQGQLGSQQNANHLTGQPPQSTEIERQLAEAKQNESDVIDLASQVIKNMNVSSEQSQQVNMVSKLVNTEGLNRFGWMKRLVEAFGANIGMLVAQNRERDNHINELSQQLARTGQFEPPEGRESEVIEERYEEVLAELLQYEALNKRLEEEVAKLSMEISYYKSQVEEFSKYFADSSQNNDLNSSRENLELRKKLENASVELIKIKQGDVVDIEQGKGSNEEKIDDFLRVCLVKINSIEESIAQIQKELDSKTQKFEDLLKRHEVRSKDSRLSSVSSDRKSAAQLRQSSPQMNQQILEEKDKAQQRERQYSAKLQDLFNSFKSSYKTNEQPNGYQIEDFLNHLQEDIKQNQNQHIKSVARISNQSHSRFQQLLQQVKELSDIVQLYHLRANSKYLATIKYIAGQLGTIKAMYDSIVRLTGAHQMKGPAQEMGKLISELYKQVKEAVDEIGKSEEQELDFDQFAEDEIVSGNFKEPERVIQSLSYDLDPQEKFTLNANQLNPRNSKPFLDFILSNSEFNKEEIRALKNKISTLKSRETKINEEYLRKRQSELQYALTQRSQINLSASTGGMSRVIQVLAENLQFDEISQVLEPEGNNHDILAKITDALNLSEIEYSRSRFRFSKEGWEAFRAHLDSIKAKYYGDSPTEIIDKVHDCLINLLSAADDSDCLQLIDQVFSSLHETELYFAQALETMEEKNKFVMDNHAVLKKMLEKSSSEDSEDFRGILDEQKKVEGAGTNSARDSQNRS